MNPTVPFRIPPTKGIKPNIVVIGEKNRQIPITIIKYVTPRRSQVNILDFSTALAIIYVFDIISSYTKSIYSIGFNNSDMQLEIQQHAGRLFFSIFPFPSKYAIGNG